MTVTELSKVMHVFAKGDFGEIACEIGGNTSTDRLSLENTTQDEFFRVALNGKGYLESFGFQFACDVFSPNSMCMTPDGLGAVRNQFAYPVKGAFAVLVKLADMDEWVLVGIADRGADISCFEFDGSIFKAGWTVGHSINGVISREMVFLCGKEPEMLLERYKDICRKMIPEAASLNMDVPLGWNSWDYYSASISMDAMEREMAAINASSLKGKIRYFTLDMGWENNWGDWHPNGRFPKLEEIAAKIKSYGFEPGIWVAPMEVERITEIARFHQEYLLKGRNGQPIITGNGSPVGEICLFNFFDDNACAYFTDWFRKFYQAGFRLFKIDYIYQGMLDLLSKSDSNLGQVEYVRRIFAAAKAGLGPDARLLNCGAPREGAAGYADIARTGGDIHNFWSHIRACSKRIAAMHWQNRLLWVSDPDFAIYRTVENSNNSIPMNNPYGLCKYNGVNYWTAGEEASELELKTWLSMVRVCGGSICYSDSIASLKPDAVDMLSRLIPPVEAPAQPLNVFKEELPRFWKGKNFVGIFNWSEFQLNISLDEQDYLPDTMTDFWSGKKVEKLSGLPLAPHEGTILIW